MGKKLAAVATDAVTADKGFERGSGYCQKWVRQCVQKLHGHRFDEYFKGSAVETMEAFRNSPYAVKVSDGSVPGDILYKGRKTSGTYGHTGIRVPGNRVAENSSSHINEAGDRDARGFRSLDAFGKYELIVRLEDPK